MALQETVVRQRRAGEVVDQLLLLEHPHVVTLGGSARVEHVRAGRLALAARGVELHRAGRGGDVTYHGPGQLVGYPVLDLKPDRCDAHRYLRDLEAVLIGALGDFGLEARRDPAYTGVWIGQAKIAAIGVRISSGWITSHGFALNVAPDLSCFDLIVPCGIPHLGVTSMAEQLGEPPPLDRVRSAVARSFARVFGRDALPAGSSHIGGLRLTSPATAPA